MTILDIVITAHLFVTLFLVYITYDQYKLIQSLGSMSILQAQTLTKIILTLALTEERENETF